MDPEPSTSAAPQAIPMGAEMPDVETVVAQYTGHARLSRLLFVARRAADQGEPGLEQEALRAAFAQAKQSEDLGAYANVSGLINGRLGPECAPDNQWAESVEKRLADRQKRLETELEGYKANSIKESIRMGHNFLGEFFYNKGDAASALKCYIRTRDYCTTSKHVISMCLHVIKVSVELGNYVQVLNYLQKAEQTPDVAQDAKVVDKLKCAAGLAHLAHKKYKLAARKFLDVSADFDGSYSDVVAPQDVAAYGALCALASFDRQELGSRLINNAAFRNLIELVPEVREVVQDFYASRYAVCLKTLARLRRYYAYDVHLHGHLEELCRQVHEKALVQYALPFTSVVMRNMAQAFNTDVASLEKELAALIAKGQIAARIDSHNKVLYGRQDNQRSATFQQALKVGEEYARDVRGMLLRASLLRQDLVQRSKPPSSTKLQRPGVEGPGAMQRG